MMYGATPSLYSLDKTGRQNTSKLKKMQRKSKVIIVTRICMKVGFRSISRRKRTAMAMAFPVKIKFDIELKCVCSFLKQRLVRSSVDTIWW